MDKITTLNTLKNVFSALGAKTSDDNYAVGLFDKTSAEPKGIMGMSDLSSVLGGILPMGDGDSTTNIDTLIGKSSAIAITANNSSNPKTSIGVVVTIFASSSYGIQLFFTSSSTSRRHYFVGWGPWTDL